MHLERLTSILEFVGQKGDASILDICTGTDLPKASTYRLVQDLVEAGLLETVAKGRFAIGARLKRITHRDHSDEALLELIGPALKQAASAHGAAFFLSRLRGRRVEIIHVETPDTGVSYLYPGLGGRPLHACSCSKVIAAFSPELLDERELEGRLRAYTEFTLTRIEDLQAEFVAIRQRGYAECVEEIERGMCSVAAPIGQSGPGKTLSIGATGSVRVFNSSFRRTIGVRLVGLANELSLTLGWETPSLSNTPDEAQGRSRTITRNQG